MAQLYPLPTNLKLVFFYNVCSFIVWFCCFIRFLILLPLVGRMFLPGGISDFFHVVSILPIVEFFLIKFCISFKFSLYDIWPLLNSVKMVWISYGVIFPHPRVAKHTSYSFLITAWCLSNIIHYSYYSFRIKTRSSPNFLFWLNYHHHYVIFPISLISEFILVFLSLGLEEDNLWLEFLLKTTLLSYIPLAYFQWEYLNITRMNRFKSLKLKIENNRSTNA